MILRRLNSEGIVQMSSFLESLTTEIPQPWPGNLLSSSETSEPVEPEIDFELRTFGSRFAAAEYLDERFYDARISGLERDKGIWSWLALFYFEELCPAGEYGHRKPGARARWIPEAEAWRYYRHLLAGPFLIYRAHRDNPERVLVLLCGPLNQPGDIVEQLASRQELVTNKSTMEVATILFLNRKTNQPKRGAAGRGPGSARRLADVFNQFDVTWDLYAMNSGDLFEMLPAEFDRFRSKSA